MRKTILKTALCLSMFLCFTGSAKAFIFTDGAALVQRAAQFVSTVSHYAASVTHFSDFVRYTQEFNSYRNQFTSYYNNFKNVYRRLSSGDYFRDFDVSNWNWTRLDDHILRTWRTYNQAAWDLQMLALRTSRLYETNPAYRRYADRLVALSEERIDGLRQEEALSLEMESRSRDRREALARLKETNERLVTGDAATEVDAGQLQALNNRILLELAAIQVENNIIDQRRVARELEINNLIAEMRQLEVEAQQTDVSNLNFIFESTTR